MQLIAIILALFALVALFGALLFLGEWRQAKQSELSTPLIREGISHIGISAIVAYPKSVAPLYALLDEEYPRSEAIIVTDLDDSPFGALLRHFKLIGVNHSHLKGVRALYRSRHRAFRRIVIIDLPTSHRKRAFAIAEEVATYDCTLRLQGESIIAHNALTYCANLVASQPYDEGTMIRPLVGADATLVRGEPSNHPEVTLTAQPLAWRRASLAPTVMALLLPAILVAVSRFTGEWILLVVAGVISLTMVLLISLSYRLMCKKGLLELFAIIIENFYRFSIEKFKKIYYLYKGDRAKKRNTEEEGLPMLSTATLQEKNNQNDYDREAH